MGSRGRPLFDLNEVPTEDDVVFFHPQKGILSTTGSRNSELLGASAGPKIISTNHALSHLSSPLGVEPSSGHGDAKIPEMLVPQTRAGNRNPEADSSSKSLNKDSMKAAQPVLSGHADAQAVEREEGEWSDTEGSAEAFGSNNLYGHGRVSHRRGTPRLVDGCYSGLLPENITCNVKNAESFRTEISPNLHGQDTHSSRNAEANGKSDIASLDGQEEPGLFPKQREVKGIEASHAIKCANNIGKKKMDQQREAMLGKKRNRQTMFLKLEDVKQAGSIKTSTPRRQSTQAPISTRTVKDALSDPVAEHVGENQSKLIIDRKQVEVSEGGAPVESAEPNVVYNGDLSSGVLARPTKLNSESDFSSEVTIPPIPRQGSWKHPTDLWQSKNSQALKRKPSLISQNSVDSNLGNKRHLPAKKQTAASSSSSYQDTSVERLIREVTNEKIWHHPEDIELQCIPGRFESVQEYVGVFEPLLFVECRAQLYNAWEELTEMVSRDTHVMVRIKSVERRERGWYDVVVLPVNECKWAFKEGDVAILSAPRPGSVRSRRNFSLVEDNQDLEHNGRVAGTIRRYIPIDTRDPCGAILHFYVGDSYDPSLGGDNHILKKLQPKGIWYVTALGSLATTQREYIALNAFHRLNLQMQAAILQPSPEHFPKYEQQTPAMPECFTQNFADHLRRTFNEPQLAAIQWAATHTAAGTSTAVTKRQDPWPFTLVQGPPGTGKTHTVWGMLNVIHLVQYQHYYTSLLKKLAPESYKQANESSCDNVTVGSIDEVLQSMEQNLFRTLPKLCPKPRMLVCAPSNAATDELLSRVLDRGFIDGEMKVYRPDVARVGVDTQTRAAQAVSVERRTEQLLVKNREEVLLWMRELRVRESHFSQQIAVLQRELMNAAATVRSQGSVGVDPDVLVSRDQNRDSLLQKLAEMVEGRDKVLVEISRFHILEGRFRGGSNFNLEEARASLEASFANEAEIVFTTVSSSGRKLFSRLSHGFDMVVIDEAAQASEVAVLPPLSLGAARCVLVGDPQQLPATVISKAAGTLLYSRSLFERLQQAGCPTMLLSVQYRMHPQIREFPSRYFYQGRLTDSESVVNLPNELYYKDPLLRPYIFFDITHGRESHRGGSVSYQNIHEAQFCFRIYEHLQRTLRSLGLGKVSIGIITPYKLQLKCIQREFEGVLHSEEGKDLYINTIDAFQGQERDVIIMSCVRASTHGVGFVADIRRMNVALTRARRALWVMGNANSLMQSDDWAALITDAKARKAYMDMDSLPKDFLVPMVPAYNALPGKNSFNMRGMRSNGPRR